MKVTYIEDRFLPLLGEWNNEEQLGDPYHPAHGPLPDLYGVVECKGERFLVGLWDAADGKLHTMLEMEKKDSEDDDVPLLDIDECHHMRGWIAQFHTWELEEGHFTCRGRMIEMPKPYNPTEEWELDCYRQVMRGSVSIAATDPIRAPTFYRAAKRISLTENKS